MLNLEVRLNTLSVHGLVITVATLEPGRTSALEFHVIAQAFSILVFLPAIVSGASIAPTINLGIQFYNIDRLFLVPGAAVVSNVLRKVRPVIAVPTLKPSRFVTMIATVLVAVCLSLKSLVALWVCTCPSLVPYSYQRFFILSRKNC